MIEIKNLLPLATTLSVGSNNQCVLEQGPNLKALPEIQPANIRTIANTLSSAIDWSNSEDFGGDPIPIDRLEPLKFTEDIFPRWMSNYLSELAIHHNIPIEIVTVNAFAIVAAVLQKGFVVSPRKGYAEPLSIWCLTATPSSINNSRVLDALKAPLQLQKQQVKKWSDDIGDGKVCKAFYSKVQQGLIREAAKAEIEARTTNVLQTSVADRQSKYHKAKDLLNSARIVRDEGSKLASLTLWKFLATDLKQKNLLNDLAHNYEKITILAEDPSLLNSIDTALLLKGYSGGPFTATFDNNGPAVFDDIAITIGLTTTPEQLKHRRLNNRRHSARQLELCSKFLYCITNSSKHPHIKQPINKNTQAIYNYGIECLLKIPPAVVENIPPNPFTPSECSRVARILHLDPGAIESWEEFNEFVETKLFTDTRFDSIQDWVANLPNIALRIAGLIHITNLIALPDKPLSTLSLSSIDLTDAKFLIPKRIMELAISVCTQLISHAFVAYQLLDYDETIADAKFVYEWLPGNTRIDEYGRLYIKHNELHKTSRFKNSPGSRVITAEDKLSGFNILSPPCTLPTRKPTQIRYVSPLMFNQVMVEKNSIR